MKSEPLQKLTLMEILMGALLFAPTPLFSDQDIYRIFKKSNLSERFNIEKDHAGNLGSKYIFQALSFCEIGHLLSIRSFANGHTFYRRNDDMLSSVRRELEERKILPKYQAALQQFANLLKIEN